MYIPVDDNLQFVAFWIFVRQDYFVYCHSSLVSIVCSSRVLCLYFFDRQIFTANPEVIYMLTIDWTMIRNFWSPLPSSLPSPFKSSHEQNRKWHENSLLVCHYDCFSDEVEIVFVIQIKASHARFVSRKQIHLATRLGLGINRVESSAGFKYFLKWTDTY